MKIVVTGGSGLAGFAVVRHLLECGHEVVSLDRVPLPEQITEYRFVDCGDLGQVYGACDGADAIVHLAAIPRPVNHTPDQVFRTNIMATFNVLEVAATLGIARVVYISSVSVLGLPFSYGPVTLEYFPINEEHPRAPQDAYALSKTLGEDIAVAFVRRASGNLSVVSLRLPWIHTPETFKSILTPFWEDPAGGASNLWSYIDTRDVGRACMLSVDAKITGHEEIFVSANNTFMKQDTSKLIREYYPQAKVNLEFEGNQAVIDTTKANTMIGYEANYSWEDYQWN